MHEKGAVTGWETTKLNETVNHAPNNAVHDV
jgi:hypothetical protein